MTFSNKLLRSIYHKLVQPARFALASFAATGVDYTVFWLLIVYGKDPVTAQPISAFCGMLLNFSLQRRFVFELKRRLPAAFMISLAFSVFSLATGTWLMSVFIQFNFFRSFPLAAKVPITMAVFLLNFFSKRFAFERKLPFHKNRDTGRSNRSESPGS